MATRSETVTTPVELDMNERVPIKIPRESGGDDYQYVSVNDYTANIEKGVTVMVPRYVAMEIQRSMDAEEIKIMNKRKAKEASRNQGNYF